MDNNGMDVLRIVFTSLVFIIGIVILSGMCVIACARSGMKKIISKIQRRKK